MYEYIEKLLGELPADMQGLETTPTSSYLFNTHPEHKKLNSSQTGGCQ